MKRRLTRSMRLAVIEDFPEPLQEALAYWGALRNLGFDADDIHFGFSAVSGVADMVHIALITQGKEFVIMVRQMRGVPRSKVIELWLKLGTVMQNSNIEERDRNYRKFLVGSSRDYFTAMALAIRDKGIVIPELALKEAIGKA